MTIEINQKIHYGKIICDICRDTEEFFDVGLDSLRKDAKDSGWVNFTENEKIVDVCPSCWNYCPYLHN